MDPAIFFSTIISALWAFDLNSFLPRHPRQVYARFKVPEGRYYGRKDDTQNVAPIGAILSRHFKGNIIGKYYIANGYLETKFRYNMSNTYSQITIQIVFAVKGRENILHENLRPELFKYINGVIKGKDQFPLAVNGWKDHVHVLFGLSPNISISEMARDIKANSSKWINEHKLVKSKFSWQEGFGAFSYSRSQRDDVIKYIINQEKHHTVKTFREEYVDMLRKSEIEYNEKYLFEFYD